MTKNSKAIILVVDDNRTNLKILVDYLDEAGFKTLIATNGERAIEQAKRRPPDLILLDILMPGIDGFETCRRLKADKVTQEIPIIFMTALADVDHKVMGFEVGGVDYVTKPFQQKELLARITTHLTIRNLRRALQASEVRYRSIVQDQTDLICRFTPDGGLTFVNAAYCRYVGKQAEAVWGTPFWSFILTDDRPKFQATLALLNQDTPVTSHECRGFRQNGQLRWQQWTLRSIFNNEGEVVEYQAVGQDITERKQAENALKEANQILEQLANIDGLTQVANRHHFEAKLIYSWQTSAQFQYPLSLILADIDYFKRFNDTYGHQAGDVCLRKIAEAINRAARRAADVVARYGGEEFAVILLNTDLEGANFVARAIQREVAYLQIKHERSKVADYVTLSLGIATLVPSQTDTPTVLVEMADQAMYEAKKEGRNCIVARQG